jgi:nicotinamidase-related amidase
MEGDAMSTALLVVDMLNTYDHEDGDTLADSVRRTIPNIRRLIDAAQDNDVLTVWVNDNHGDWTVGRQKLTDWARDNGDPDLIDPIAPPNGVPFLVKARHSAFYATQLEYLLHEQGVDHIILTGQVTEQCILYSALDAYVRQFQITVPRDAVAHIHQDMGDAALRMMERNMSAAVPGTDEAVHALASGAVS